MIEVFKNIQLDREAASPLYIQLYSRLKALMENGTLLPDFRLPSIRQLTELLSVNQVTVVSALKRLESEGYIYSKPGSGVFVANLPMKPSDLLQDELYRQEDFGFMGSRQITITENTINFASATPTPDLFPVDDFKQVLNEVLERDRGNAFIYQESQGYLPARESIGMMLEKSNIQSNPDNIMIISGAQQGIDIISKAILGQADMVLTESPTYMGAIAVFKSRNAQIIDVEIHPDGPNMKALEYLLKTHRPKLMYTIPSFQNPTGYSYSMDKRLKLLELAEKYNLYIIEDDYVSELDFEGKGYRTLKSLDHSDRVIFIKSFSKLFMPGLRIGFMVIPKAIRSLVLEAKHTTDISTSALIQRAFDLYIRKGCWERHFNFVWKIYRDKYFKMIHALDTYLPDSASYTKPGGGLNFWVNLPAGMVVNTLERMAQSYDLVFSPGRIFYSGAPVQNLNSIRLSFASVYEEQIEPGIKTLCSLIRSLLDGKTQIHVPVL